MISLRGWLSMAPFCSSPRTLLSILSWWGILTDWFVKRPLLTEEGVWTTIDSLMLPCPGPTPFDGSHPKFPQRETVSLPLGEDLMSQIVINGIHNLRHHGLPCCYPMGMGGATSLSRVPTASAGVPLWCSVAFSASTTVLLDGSILLSAAATFATATSLTTSLRGSPRFLGTWGLTRASFLWGLKGLVWSAFGFTTFFWLVFLAFSASSCSLRWVISASLNLGNFPPRRSIVTGVLDGPVFSARLGGHYSILLAMDSQPESQSGILLSLHVEQICKAAWPS